MERYEELWIEVVIFDGADVITGSNITEETTNNDNEGEQMG